MKSRQVASGKWRNNSQAMEQTNRRVRQAYDVRRYGALGAEKCAISQRSGWWQSPLIAAARVVKW